MEPQKPEICDCTPILPIFPFCLYSIFRYNSSCANPHACESHLFNVYLTSLPSFALIQLDYLLSRSPHGVYVAAALVHLVLGRRRSHLEKPH